MEQAEVAPDRAPAAAERGLHEAVGVRLQRGDQRVGALRVPERGARLGDAGEAGEAEEAARQAVERGGERGLVGRAGALALARPAAARAAAARAR